MKIAQGILFIQLLCQITKCSRIIDEHSQKGIPIDDYCHKIGVCEEGTHVMCLYYNPNRLMGPACQNYVNITITPDYAQIILNIMNKIRSKAAKGTLKGKDDILLPRGYGIYKLEWDEELATFAQLWANQCILKNDMCHATKNFPEPGQTLGLIRYTIKDWKPINFPEFSNSTTLTPDKVKYAILSVLEAWYDLKSFMTPDDIKQLDNRASQFPYLIHGRSTHIGCGLSAYSEFAYHNNRADLIYNSLQMVCNYSTRVRRGTSVYTTDPPTMPGYTVRCGCPLGYDEDNDCLCYKSGRSMANNYSCKNNERCKPAVVVLPIFKVEEAPASKIGNNVTRLLDTTNEIFDRYDMVHKRTVNDYRNLFDNLQNMDHSNMINRRFPLDVQTRRFGVKLTSQNVDHSSIHHDINNLQNQKYSTKRSIFSKPIFELPMRRTKNISNQTQNRQIHVAYKKDVPPRKDFTEAQKLVSKYLKNKRAASDVERVTRNNINNVYNHSNSTNRLMTDINSHTDTKLMKLLDKLELEVRNTNFNKNNKELFDSKIRKIYGSLIGRTDALEHNDNYGNGFNDSDIVKKYDKILKSKPLYRNREDFALNDGENLNKELRYKFRKENYRITDYINDTETDKKFDGRRKLKKKSTNIVREDFWDSDYNNGNDDNFALDSNRRSFYESKLKSLQRKLDYIKRNGHKRRASEDRRLRPVRPTKATKEFPYEKPKEPINTFYMPDRARFLHGF